MIPSRVVACMRCYWCKCLNFAYMSHLYSSRNQVRDYVVCVGVCHSSKTKWGRIFRFETIAGSLAIYNRLQDLCWKSVDGSLSFTNLNSVDWNLIICFYKEISKCSWDFTLWKLATNVQNFNFISLSSSICLFYLSSMTTIKIDVLVLWSQTPLMKWGALFLCIQ